MNCTSQIIQKPFADIESFLVNMAVTIELHSTHFPLPENLMVGTCITDEED